MRSRRAVVELIVAGCAAVGSVLSWLAASSQVVVAPVLEGEPSTTSVVYYAPLLTLSLLLVTASGVLGVLGVSRLRAAHHPRRRAPELHSTRQSSSETRMECNSGE